MQVNQLVNIQKIFTLQFHIHPSHHFTFHNTFFIECLKKNNRGIPMTIVNHEHPTNSVSQLPFAIVNATHLIPKQRLIYLLEALSQQNPMKLSYFRPIFNICQQLAAVGRIFSEEASNPYYLFLSPLKKYQVYKWNNHFKRRLFNRTQYFDHDHQKQSINKQYLVYQMDNLAQYIMAVNRQLGIQQRVQYVNEDLMVIEEEKQGIKVEDKKDQHIVLKIMIVICVHALLKSLKMHNKVLYKAATDNKLFENYERMGIELLNEGYPKQKTQQIFISTIKPEDLLSKDNKDSKKEPFNPKTQIYQKLIVPVVIVGIFWKIMKLNS